MNPKCWICDNIMTMDTELSNVFYCRHRGHFYTVGYSNIASKKVDYHWFSKNKSSIGFDYLYSEIKFRPNNKLYHEDIIFPIDSIKEPDSVEELEKLLEKLSLLC